MSFFCWAAATPRVVHANCGRLPTVAEIKADYIEPSAGEHGTDVLAAGIPTQPSALYYRFSEFDAEVVKAEQAGCGAYRGRTYVLSAGGTTSFGDEWVFQQKREAQRASALAAAVQHEAEEAQRARR